MCLFDIISLGGGLKSPMTPLFEYSQEYYYYYS